VSRLYGSPGRLVFAVLALAGACSSNPANGPVSGNPGTGAANTGGAPAANAGGTSGSGGVPTQGAGGEPGTGGTSTENTGGTTATGGTSATGTGGTSATGTGGTSATGTGGTSSTGTGGLPGSGGAGAGGAAASDFGIGGPSRCATAGVQLCEDFENGLSSTIWTDTQSGDATAVVDSMQAARGTKALHVKTTAGNGHAYITEKMTFPATGNVLYARMFVYLGDPLTTNGHFSLAEGDGTGSSGARFGGQNKFLGVGTDGASGDWTDKDNKLIPAQTWMCFEFELDGGTNDFHAWWDDVARTLLTRGAAQHPGFVMPQLNAIWFGWYMYNATEPQDLWIDEIAIDFKPIGCTK
jgi:hypothetical protein